MKIPKYLINIINQIISNRQFEVRVNDYTTAPNNIHCGLQQGGVLSPVLFAIYINDIPIVNNGINEHSMLFANDLAELFKMDKITDENTKKINDHLKKLENWLDDWRLKMSPEKCSYLIFSLNKKTGKSEQMDLKLYNQNIPIEKENNVRFLGIRFDKHMSYKNQLQYLKDTCSDRLNVLKVLAHKSWKIDTTTLTTIYKLLIRSIIDYSLHLYDIISESNKNTLQRIQNKAIRIIHNIKYSDHISVNELHNISKIETIHQRAETLRANYFNKNMNNKNPMLCQLIDEYEFYKENNLHQRHPNLLDKWVTQRDNNETDMTNINNLFGE